MFKIFNYFKIEKKRLGRGISSGFGKTCSRGHKGQKSRSGFNIPNLFEGGQTNFVKNKPKILLKKKKKKIFFKKFKKI
ncbi:putative ribosomal protein L15 [Candidatus Carsonella ruddii CS isolate Thao2000]|uniref:50S ribosomal protein L15 n=1 Tax=Candidatus Carsonella ruddii CS isolate Thao2000 TaxID=1202537 RepID=J7GYX5_CARRU|nr:uL15 family ribosomal protein [Candidatus Carsonella ruddii]AFP83813.1 putative ribosomal protein L15 [Candidatus Carsonella ruddii CS isolate Thao2000]